VSTGVTGTAAANSVKAPGRSYRRGSLASRRSLHSLLRCLRTASPALFARAEARSEARTVERVGAFTLFAVTITPAGAFTLLASVAAVVRPEFSN